MSTFKYSKIAIKELVEINPDPNIIKRIQELRKDHWEQSLIDNKLVKDKEEQNERDGYPEA